MVTCFIAKACNSMFPVFGCSALDSQNVVNTNSGQHLMFLEVEGFIPKWFITLKVEYS